MPADQGVLPLLEEDPRPAGKAAGRGLNGLQAARQLRDQGPAFFRGAHQIGQGPDDLQDLAHAPLIEGQDGQSSPDQLGGDVRLQIRERQHQVRAQLLDPVQPGAGESRDPRLGPGLPGPHRVSGDAHDAGPFSQEIEGFRGFLGQTDDAAGIARRPVTIEFSAHCLPSPFHPTGTSRKVGRDG